MRFGGVMWGGVGGRWRWMGGRKGVWGYGGGWVIGRVSLGGKRWKMKKRGKPQKENGVGKKTRDKK